MPKVKSLIGDDEKETIAAKMVAVSAGFLRVPDAMKICKMDQSLIDNESIHRRIRRLAKQFQAKGTPAEGSTEPPAPEPPNNMVTNPDGRNQRKKRSLSTSSSGSTPRPRSLTQLQPLVRRLDDSVAGLGICQTPSLDDPITPALKKQRRTSKQKHRDDAAEILKKKIESRGMKAATTRVAANNKLEDGNPEKKSNNEIVREVNAAFGSNVITKTAIRAVKDGRIGDSPLKRGPSPELPKHIWEALKTAYVTCIKLEQSQSSTQSPMSELMLMVNACVNAGGFQKKGCKLVNKLKQHTADHFVVDKRNYQEQRRVQWTTFSNLKLWFDAFEMTLIELGFARPKHADDNQQEIIGDLFFFPGQRRRIINFDETDGSMDNTTGLRGGRPPVVFYCSDVRGGATRANKSSYSPTIICGSNAAGEALPPHFQLKSTAQAHNQQTPVMFVGNAKQIWGRFGHAEAKWHDCSFGLNDKAGMNAVELEKCINTAIAPLYPDAEDAPGKRVIMKVDSGPGRSEENTLATNRLRGMCVTPGVPNTNGKTQETDQNYGPFKTGHRGNLRMLAAQRFEEEVTVKVTDLPLLVFGNDSSADGSTLSVDLPDVFANTFSKQNNLGAWAKCGAVPLTRSVLMSPDVRHEVATEDGIEQDPEAAKLIELDRANTCACAHLTNFGFAGHKLFQEPPKKIKRKQPLTRPHTADRVQANMQTNASGKLNHATGGDHLNSDDVFVAMTAKGRLEKIEALEKEKKERLTGDDIIQSAKAVIEAKGAPTSTDPAHLRNWSGPELKALAKCRTDKDHGNKEKNAKAYLEAPTPEKQPWTEEDEQRLQQFKDINIPLKETALGVVATQNAKSVVNHLNLVDETTRQRLLEALQGESAEENTEGNAEAGGGLVVVDETIAAS